MNVRASGARRRGGVAESDVSHSVSASICRVVHVVTRSVGPGRIVCRVPSGRTSSSSCRRRSSSKLPAGWRRGAIGKEGPVRKSGAPFRDARGIRLRPRLVEVQVGPRVPAVRVPTLVGRKHPKTRDGSGRRRRRTRRRRRRVDGGRRKRGWRRRRGRKGCCDGKSCLGPSSARCSLVVKLEVPAGPEANAF